MENIYVNFRSDQFTRSGVIELTRFPRLSLGDRDLWPSDLLNVISVSITCIWSCLIVTSLMEMLSFIHEKERYKTDSHTAHRHRRTDGRTPIQPYCLMPPVLVGSESNEYPVLQRPGALMIPCLSSRPPTQRPVDHPSRPTTGAWNRINCVSDAADYISGDIYCSRRQLHKSIGA